MSEIINVYGLAKNSIVDGPGLRFAIFVQGCSHNCKNCHNPNSHPYSGGTEYTIDSLIAMIKSDPLVSGVTLSGGEPFDQAYACGELAYRLKNEGYNIWTYTGYLFEDLCAASDSSSKDKDGVRKLLQNTDVLIDGPFVSDLNSYSLKWKGSSNQRILDVPASIAADSPVFWVASS